MIYRALLRLLPRQRRTRDGEAMAVVFDELRQATRRERGWLALGVLWMNETGGLVRFGLRERFARRGAAGSGHSPHRGGGWDVASELRWAWRAVRARGWRGAFIVALLAITLAANALIFAATDSLVFRTAPYPNGSQLFELWRPLAGRPGSYERYLSLPELQQWQKQTDLFGGVYGYQSRTAFVLGGDMTERVRVADVQPGLIEGLGVRPAWGRSLLPGDGLDAGLDIVLLSDGLARRHFGRPELAPGRQLQTLTVPMHIAGVMAPDFAFPDASHEIWRAFDLGGPLTRDTFSAQSIARITPGLSVEALTAAVAQRSAAIAAAAGRPSTASLEPRPHQLANAEPAVFYVLLGAALCLLLTACANVASLELAGALRRSHAYSVQLALGATRGTIARVALLEGATLVGFAALIAMPLTLVGMKGLGAFLPAEFQRQTANPIDLDGRLLAFMLAAAGLTWLLGILPMLAHATRADLLGLLKGEDRSTAASRKGARARTVLTIAEVAIAIVLVVGGLLYVRTYQALLAVDKGFDSSNLAELDFTMPGSYRPRVDQGTTFAQEVLLRVSSLPGVLGASLASPPPNAGNSPRELHLDVDDRGPASGAIDLGQKLVDEPYLRVVGLPLRGGRWLTPADPDTNVVVTESFGRYVWPGEDPVGHRFREDPKRPWRVVVGVVGAVLTDVRPHARRVDNSFYYYSHLQPTPPPQTQAPAVARRDVGATTRFVSISVRLRSLDDAAQVLAAARTVDPKLRATLDLVDDTYATQFSGTLLATRIVGAFAILAFVVAIAGVYGVMAFLVAGRTREIGIRMALGATARDISRLVLRSSMTMVLVGAGVGIAAALVASRWTAAQFFGVAPTAPGTYVIVTAVVVATSLLATWRPARAAARVDPAKTLNQN